MTSPCALCLALVVLASPSPKAPDASSDVAEREYERGVALYRSGQYREAIRAFEASYAAKPHAALQFNIGQAYEKLGEPAAALEAYRRYLHDAPDAKDRGSVEATIAALEQRVAEQNIQTLRVRSVPPDAAVEIDRASRGKTPLELRLPVGDHQVDVSLEGYLPAHRGVSLTSKAAVELDFALEPKLAKPKFWTWVALGTAGALAAAGGTFGILAWQDSSTMQAYKHDQVRVDALHDGASAKSVTANVLYGLAGAAGLAGGALFFVEGSF